MPDPSETGEVVRVAAREPYGQVVDVAGVELIATVEDDRLGRVVQSSASQVLGSIAQFVFESRVLQLSLRDHRNHLDHDETRIEMQDDVIGELFTLQLDSHLESRRRPSNPPT